MGKSCCAVYCTNRFSKNSELSFYRLPKAKEKRSKWITAIHRNNWNPGTEAWICSSHFVSGKKSDDPLHPDYVPSLFSFTSTTDRNLAVRNLERFLQSQKVSEKRPISRELAATALLNLRSPVSEAEVQTEETYNDITSLHEQIKSLNAECQSLRDKVHKLESELKHLTLDSSQFDDSKMKFFTGLPNLHTFMLLFSYVSSVLPVAAKQSLKPTQELLLTLMKLRLNLSEELLGHLFRIHQSTVSRIFRRWIYVMENRLDPLISCPEREDLIRNLPRCFLTYFKKKNVTPDVAHDGNPCV
ncbi:THAP domain-containing protein 1 isoform X1 [Electrophorus electricus]|uniref:THAP domain-containing protein 1 isoform X1 n=1 Tax=Electrophorus electricus TaxID=8005 RepID=UPI000F09A6DC|nr:THAP domain-containing protein 1 isoform X1 [Electrophorus electricus]